MPTAKTTQPPKSKSEPKSRSDFAAQIIENPVQDEVSEAFVAYSLSVISSRAIPDVRDGLKPVQRRILYSMLNMGIRPDTPFRKCARVVGDTMGNYHPHGDAAIYDALVRMGQDFSRGITLIDPQGNFGSLDDPPAASRYTECRLAESAMDMLAELNEDAVDFRPTYDGESEEPVCLPSLVPNLLINGASGIAVGMTTNISPHNLVEVYEAIKLSLKKRNPKPSVKELMAKIPGPDFPSGGIIIDEGLEEIYKDGKGSFKIRAKAEIVPLKSKQQGILITELPYLVGPERVIAKIKELMLADKLPEISDVKNLSDMHSGLRIQIECRQNSNPAALIQKLWKLTPLEEIHAVSSVALVKGVPRTLSLREMCEQYIKHRLSVIIRRTKYRLKKAKDRLHIIEGLVKALDNIDLVISIIRGSKTTEEARKKLREGLKLTIIQADSILEMRLRRLTALERQKIIDERDELKADIKGYEKLLASEKEQRDTVSRELGEIVELYGRERRTVIMAAEDIEDVEHIAPISKKKAPEQPCLVSLSTSGIVGWEPQESERTKPGRHDLIASLAYTNTASTVWAFTSQGRCLSSPVSNLGQVEGRRRGSSAQQVFGTNAGEDVLLVAGEDAGESLVVLTELGLIKHLDAKKFSSLKPGDKYINLKSGDKVASVFTTLTPSDEIVIVADDAKALKLGLSEVRPLGPQAAGITGMKLKTGTKVVAAGSCIGESYIVITTNDGCAKALEASQLELRGRGGQGVKICPLKDGQKISIGFIGALDGLLAIMADDNNPQKADSHPVNFSLNPEKKELIARKTDRQILELGTSRW